MRGWAWGQAPLPAWGQVPGVGCGNQGGGIQASSRDKEPHSVTEPSRRQACCAASEHKQGEGVSKNWGDTDWRLRAWWRWPGWAGIPGRPEVWPGGLSPNRVKASIRAQGKGWWGTPRRWVQCRGWSNMWINSREREQQISYVRKWKGLEMLKFRDVSVS